MNRFKFQAFKREFPCLEALLTGRADRPREAQHCNEIKISRLGHDFLSYIPEHVSHDGSMVGINKKEEISFVLSGGSVLRGDVQCRGTHGSNYAHSETAYEEGETVLEAIDRHQCAEALWLLVMVRSGFTVREHFSEPNFTVTVYKVAKGESLTELIEEAANAALNEVRAKANF